MADHASLLQESIQTANQQALPLSGWPKIVHHLDLAFVHALAGAEKEAQDALTAAEAEIEKYGRATYQHLEHDIALAVAKVHAVLSHSSKPAPAAKKAASAKAKTDEE